MPRASGRQLLAALAVVAIVTAAGPVPAHAAAPTFTLDILPMAVPEGTTEQREGRGIQATLRSSEDFSAADFEARRSPRSRTASCEPASPN